MKRSIWHNGKWHEIQPKVSQRYAFRMFDMHNYDGETDPDIRAAEDSIVLQEFRHWDGKMKPTFDKVNNMFPDDLESHVINLFANDTRRQKFCIENYKKYDSIDDYKSSIVAIFLKSYLSPNIWNAITDALSKCYNYFDQQKNLERA